jgi:hypothetical protein
VPVCNGRGSNGVHCCWINGAVCRFLTPDIRCSLRSELGSWAAVHADSRWVKWIKPTYDRLWPGYGCGDFPQNIPAVMNTPETGKCCWTEVEAWPI